MQPIRTIRLSLLAALLAAAAPAQGGDPTREIQEIARRVDEQLQEIDRLLLESGKKGQERSKPKELLQQARERSEAAEEGIDKLIEKLQQMKSQSSSQSGQEGEQSSGQQQQQQQSQSGQQPQGQGNRRENQTPDFVQQPKEGGQDQQPKPGGEQPGGQQQQQQQQRPDGQPQGGQEQPTGGENTRGNRPEQTPDGPGNPGQGEGTWGELQPYTNFLKNRGSAPKVPEKYRKYYEAYLKQKQAGRTDGTGSSGGAKPGSAQPGSGGR